MDVPSATEEHPFDPQKDAFFKQYLSLRLPPKVVEDLVEKSGKDWKLVLEKYDTPQQFWFDVVQQLPNSIEDP